MRPVSSRLANKTPRRSRFSRGPKPVRVPAFISRSSAITSQSSPHASETLFRCRMDGNASIRATRPSPSPFADKFAEKVTRPEPFFRPPKISAKPLPSISTPLSESAVSVALEASPAAKGAKLPASYSPVVSSLKKSSFMSTLSSWRCVFLARAAPSIVPQPRGSPRLASIL
eukprot:3441013-Prymnesium_polylepis.3